MRRNRVQAVMALTAVALPAPTTSPSPAVSPSPSPRPSTSASSSASPRASAAASSSPAASASPAPGPVNPQQWYLDYLHIDQVHQITKGSGVVVGLVDSGVGVHPDLAGSLLPGTTFGPPAARSPHGTQMAGLIAGHGRILGIAPEAKILPVTPEFANDHGGVVDKEAPVRWAVDHGARVINLSIGDDAANPAWGRAIAYALSNDVVVVAAVNDRANGTHPSGLAMAPGVVVVSGTDKDGNIDPVSLTGTVVTVAAPSRDCWSTRPDGAYAATSSTGNAAAITSGVVALIRSRYPDLDAPGVIAQLTVTADDRGAPGRDPIYGFGVINPLRALTTPIASAVPSVSPSSDTPQPPAEAQEPPGSRPLWMAIAIAGGALAIAVGFGVLGRLRAPRP
jgi:hypothetical protein